MFALQKRLKMQKEMKKLELILFIHKCGFPWIVDVMMLNGVELVASKYPAEQDDENSENLWWRPVEVEGSGFTQLFKGSIKALERYKT